MQIIDADGHINDHACGDEIATYMPKGNQMASSFRSSTTYTSAISNKTGAIPAIQPRKTG